MKNFSKTIFNAALMLSTQWAIAVSANAAPRQIVLVVAEGAAPQTIEFGRDYVKEAFGSEAEVAAETLLKTGKKGAVQSEQNGVEALRGVLSRAEKNGWKTGLVTNGDALQIGRVLYDMRGGDAAQFLNASGTDVLAGGGLNHFDAATRKTFAEAGNTVITDVEGMDSEMKGRILLAQSEGALDYALDRDGEKQSNLSEMAALALETLPKTESGDEAPYLLVVHDALLNKAAEARDTPALLEQFREVDAVLGDALGRREEKPEEYAVALLTTGSRATPRFTTENAAQKTEAIAILSQLPLSYGKAGRTLQGADAASLTAFSTDTYKGWKLSESDRAALLTGTLAPEKALRASYEPALKVAFDGVGETGSTLFALGFDASAGGLSALQNIVGQTPEKPKPAIESAPAESAEPAKNAASKP